MPYNIQSIEIFSKVDESRLDKIQRTFTPLTYQPGDKIIEYGEPVDGLYVVTGGEVEVHIPGFEGALATLGKGKSFGEMSLFNEEDQASATVIASVTAELLFCPRNVLASALSGDELLTAGFYHGSALLVAERLRVTNKKISGQITESIRTAKDLIEEVTSSNKLGVTQEEIHAAGSSIVTGMTDILTSLLAMKETGEPIPPEQIAKLADNAKDIYYSEFQVFDRVHQQLDLLKQHLENAQRILSQQEIEEIKGDTSLLK